MPIDPVNPYSAPAANLESPVFAPVATDLQVAGPGTRLAAVLLDGLLFAPLAIVVALSGITARASSGTGRDPIYAGAMALIGLYVLLLAGYQIYLLSTRGQTLGKRWMKVRIVKLDGSAPGFVHAVLLRSVVSGLPRVIPVVGSIFSLIDALFIFRQDRRCIHDMIASTRVVASGP